MLFNFLSKPLIHLNKIRLTKQQEVNAIDINKKENSNKELKKVLDYFEKSKNDGNLNEIDKRLLEILNEDVRNFNS